MGDSIGTMGFGMSQFGGLLFIVLPPPPPPPPPYVDSANYFRTDFTPEGFKRRFMDAR